MLKKLLILLAVILVTGMTLTLVGLYAKFDPNIPGMNIKVNLHQILDGKFHDYFPSKDYTHTLFDNTDYLNKINDVFKKLRWVAISGAIIFFIGIPVLISTVFLLIKKLIFKK